MRIRTPLFLLALLSLSAFGLAMRVGAAPVWVSPPGPQPGGNIAPPLNTSSEPQTKKGGLTIEGTVSIDPGKTLTIGRAGGTSRICWNDSGDGTNCRSSWAAVATATGLLTLNQTGTPTDTGYVVLHQAGVAAPEPATVTGLAGVPMSATPTFGIEGRVTGGSAGAYSTGIYGLAAAADDAAHFGVYATTDLGSTAFFDWPNAWAGYFRGDVAVSNLDTAPTAPQYDLVIGSGAAVANNLAEICLGGVCKDVWPKSSGTGLWDLSSYTLSPSTGSRSLAFAGQGVTAPVFVAVAGSGADLVVRGSAKFSSYTIGVPSPTVPPALTCGDGICTDPPENDTFCGPRPCGIPAGSFYCPEDCDQTPPGNAQVLSEDAIEVPPPCTPGAGPEGQCPVRPYHFAVAWQNPNDPDLQATRLIIRTDRFPQGQNDTSAATAALDFPPNQFIYEDPCFEGFTYYAGLYAFDQQNNFASGMIFTPLCTDANVIYSI